MFTGIIEEVGGIREIKRQGQTLRLSIAAKIILSDLKLGDSIAVNGVCLTVVALNTSYFTVEVMPITFQTSNLGELKRGSDVNLERAMSANGRFGGHLVSGHIDGVGTISQLQVVENAIIYKVHLSANLIQWCISKGSIALDGVSLTLVEVGSEWISVSLIPHTRAHTILGRKKVGSKVNVECDSMAKLVLKPSHISRSEPPSKLSLEFLQNHGYL